MKVILLGYMASGKSLIGKKLAELLNYKFIDLDDYIEKLPKFRALGCTSLYEIYTYTL